MKQSRFLLFAAMPCAALAAETVLWPSGNTVMRAQDDSTLNIAPNGAAVVKTGSRASWPGMRMDFNEGERDLSNFSRLEILVSNTTDKVRTVNLSVKSRALQGGSPGGSVELLPHRTGVIRSNLRNMPWRLDAPLALEGMNGVPSSSGGATGGAFDISKVNSFHIFYNRDGTESGFAVLRVLAFDDGAGQKVLPAATFMPFVDRFGQFKHDDWPGKIHSETELSESLRREDAWLADHAESPIPGADRFGGWKNGPQLTATGAFRTEKVRGKWWLVDPDGHLFFSHGVDCVHMGADTGITFREKYFEWLPQRDDPVFGKIYWEQKWPAAHGFYKDPAHLPFTLFDYSKANLIRKYGVEWRRIFPERAHRRIHAWGLNTVANWSAREVVNLRKTPYTSTFGTSGPEIAGSKGWWGKFRDSFAKEFIDNTRKSAEKEARQSGDDPWCIGYFVDNELSWGGDNLELARAVLRSPATQPAKLAFREQLERQYGNVAALNAAWGTGYADWDAFLSETKTPDEKRCSKDMEALHRSVVAQYFCTIRDAIRAAAPKKLYLGTRIAWGSSVVYEESARYCDVVSVNIYRHTPVRDLPPGSEDKPMINGEFHFGALDRGMFHTGLVPTQDQKERAQWYRDYVNACLDHPRFVGTHWFQWRDQALTGRTDGENYQIGFLTICDVPYPELVEAARDIAATMYRRRYGDGR
ncbi:MAG: beta-galactosidase [Kiritimatiellae bacterium]|nr:beta-galactosidase [Kiritimatiellia bacterium]